MNEKVTQMVDLLFRDVQPSEEVQALYDEVLNNCQDRFADLAKNGLQEEEALAAVMESLKGMEDVLKDYPRKEAAVKAAPEERAEEAPAEEKKGPTLFHFSPEDIHAVEAGLTFCSVEVRATDGDFQMEITGRVFSNLEPDGTLRFWQERPTENLFKGISWEKSFESFESFGDALGRFGQNLSQLVSQGFRSDPEECRVLLSLPRSIHPNVRIRTTSGEILWQDAVPGQVFALGSTSGDIRASVDEHFLLPSVEVSSTSGNVTLNLCAEKVEVNTVSGDLSWKGDTHELEMNSTSGDVDAVGRVQLIRMNSTSGDLALDLREQEAAQVFMNTVSGDVDLRVPASVREASAALNTRSGSLRTHGLDLVEDAPLHVEANSVSGDLKIHN